MFKKETIKTLEKVAIARCINRKKAFVKAAWIHYKSGKA